MEVRLLQEIVSAGCANVRLQPAPGEAAALPCICTISRANAWKLTVVDFTSYSRWASASMVKENHTSRKFSLLWVLLILGFAILKEYGSPQEKMLFVWNDFIDMKLQYINLNFVQSSLPLILCWTTSGPCITHTLGTAALEGPHHGQLADPKASEVLPRKEDTPTGLRPCWACPGLSLLLKTAACDPAMSVFGDGEASPPVCCWLGTKSLHTVSSRW